MSESQEIASLLSWARKKDHGDAAVRGAISQLSNQSVQLWASLESLINILVESKVVSQEAFSNARDAFLDKVAKEQESFAKQREEEEKAKSSKIIVPSSKIIVPN